MFSDNGEPGAFHFSLLTDGVPNAAINCGPGPGGASPGRDLAGRRAVASRGRDLRPPLRRTDHLRRRRPPRRPVAVGPRPAVGPPWLPSRGVEQLGRCPQNNFHCRFDDLRIYRGLLSDEQVAELAAR